MIELFIYDIIELFIYDMIELFIYDMIELFHRYFTNSKMLYFILVTL